MLVVVVVVVVVVVIVVVWVMKYREVRSATCHCKGLGRVLTRQLEPLFLLSLPAPREFDQTAQLHPLLFSPTIYAIVRPAVPPRWTVTRDSGAGRKRRFGGARGEQRARAVSPQPLPIP